MNFAGIIVSKAKALLPRIPKTAAFCQSHGGSGPNDGATPAAVPSNSVKVIEVAKRIFPDHVRGLAGLTIVQDGEGREATPEGLCEETALLPLAGEIISRLIAVSEIAESDEKN